ncbi:MAG TPA: sodium/proline symporter [Bacteroidales bacterium]|nr:sodium/proline symporter [Bacteroidales bacterium]HPM88383.1 sodium/proline symporter [Bacteroidales bacterium]HQM70106.1 sodium/proline symporter [Bacteroidales bacterium]
MDNQVVMLLVVVIYLVLCNLLALYQGRKVKTGSDYAIAGRKLPGWAAALSERSAGESSWALLGLPGAAYATGLTEIWTAIGCVAGIITAWIFLAWRLRDEAEKYNVSTFTEYLEAKHGKPGRTLRTISSLVIVFFFFFYIGAQFLGGGKTFYILFGLKPVYGVIITAAVIIPYAVYGGFRSVVYMDVIQAILMIITLIAGPVVGIIYLMNNPDVFASGIPQALVKSGETYTSLTGAVKGFGAGLIITGGFSWFFGYLGGLPQLSVRFMAIKDAKQAGIARNIGIIWTIIAYIGALSIGWIGLALFGPTGLNDPEYVMPSVMLKLFPPVIAALLITGAVAAMISTADSLLILSATELSESILKRRELPGVAVDHSRTLRKQRITTAVVALVAIALSYISPSKLIFTIVSYVWAGIGCTFSVVILFTLFWKRYHGRAAIVTVISGLLFTIFWISGGYEQNYRVTQNKTDLLVSQQIIQHDDAVKIMELDKLKFISAAKLEKAIIEKVDMKGKENTLPVISSSFISKGIPARLMTFMFTLMVAVLSTFIIPPSGYKNR